MPTQRHLPREVASMNDKNVRPQDALATEFRSSEEFLAQLKCLERRRHLRKEWPEKLLLRILEIDGELADMIPVRVIAFDIAPGGFGFRAPQVLPIATIFETQLDALPGCPTIRAEIMRREHVRGSIHSYGARFLRRRQ